MGRIPDSLLPPSLMRACLLLAAWLLAACSSLPEVSYLHDRNLAPRASPTVHGSRGTIADGKARAMIASLESRAGPTDILARHLAAEEAISGRPLIAGNKVVLLDDGPETMRAMMEAVRNAKRHVNLETYIIEADEVGEKLATLMMEKSRAGVAVNLIYDSVGSFGTPPEYFDRLRAAGVRVLEFNPVNPGKARRGWTVNQRDHRKILVVDGRIAFTGGVNISRVYGKSSFLQARRSAPPPKDPNEAAWRDTHMRIEGPVVAEFQRMFLETWRRQSGSELPDAGFFPPLKTEGRALVRAIGSTPGDGDYSVYKTYVSALASADRSAYITTAYFVPDRQVVQAMVDAARRGVDVRIIFPSFTDVGMLLYAGRSYYDELLAAGIKVYERKAAMLHAKTAVIDGVWSTIGSTNLDMRSFLHNDEVNAVILDVEFAVRMEELFRRDLEDSEEITAEAWRQRGLVHRLKEWSVRLLEYWL